jgi:hypothetical protein
VEMRHARSVVPLTGGSHSAPNDPMEAPAGIGATMGRGDLLQAGFIMETI